MVFGVEFGTLETLKMSIWCTRNTNFHISGLPKSRLGKKSPQSSKKVVCGLNFGTIFGALLVKSATRNQVKKGVGKKLEKSGQKEVCHHLAVHRGMDLETQTACWGGRGGIIIYNQKLYLVSNTPLGQRPGEFLLFSAPGHHVFIYSTYVFENRGFEDRGSEFLILKFLNNSRHANERTGSCHFDFARLKHNITINKLSSRGIEMTGSCHFVGVPVFFFISNI